jgi:hypothetical protein
MKKLFSLFLLLLLIQQFAQAQGAVGMAPAPTVSAETIAAYRAAIAAKVNNDPAMTIQFTDEVLGGFISTCEGIGLSQGDIEAYLCFKVRKDKGVTNSAWLLDAKSMTAAAQSLWQNNQKNRIQFQEGWDMCRAYRHIQDKLVAGGTCLPAEYLEAGYLDERIGSFEGKASYLVTGVNYTKFTEGKPLVGFPDGQFVAPPSVIDEVLANADGDIAKIEVALGIPAGAWQGKGGIYRIDIADATALQLRLPSGGEIGANVYWQPGGYTSGGMPEGFVNQIPQAALTATQVIP